MEIEDEYTFESLDELYSILLGAFEELPLEQHQLRKPLEEYKETGQNLAKRFY